MIKILTRIADLYTTEPDMTPELTLAHFVSDLAKNVRNGIGH